jgi:hypothetical protein
MIMGTRDQHANHQTTEAAIFIYIYIYIYIYIAMKQTVTLKLKVSQIMTHKQL